MTASRSLFPDYETDLDNRPALPPGVVYVPDCLSVDDQCRLVGEIDAKEWSLELKRRVQHYGYRYDYKSRRIDPSMRLGPLPDFAIALVAGLPSLASFDREPDQLIVNEYLPGQGISAHVDCPACFDHRVAMFSLGWPYEMEFRHLDSPAVAKMVLGVGSLLVLTGESRYRWTHQIRARRQDRGILRQRRLSLTFRTVLLSE
jgi:alkylated DNA repair dioxygenase AlkB